MGYREVSNFLNFLNLNTMSVSVKALTKKYGEQSALNAIHFEAKKGEVLGFLGPNGAGKTTTMKIITCFVPQTDGEATVCGFDVRKEPLEVRRQIGYLPEHNPLYKDMYVKEYLTFVAGVYKLSNKTARVKDMIEMTGLGIEQNKLIGSLSKGYRQRVGLAQAMIHDPKVLILDEPTSGLDPNQLVEIRKLIKDLGKEKTVIFSTHIMQEVQSLCDRVVIINNGNIVADGDISTLQNNVVGQSVVKVEFLQKVTTKQLSAIPNVLSVNELGKNRFQISASLQSDIRADIFAFAVQNNLVLLEMAKEISSVEDVFQQLTAV